jgi:hypothetical protein
MDDSSSAVVDSKPLHHLLQASLLTTEPTAQVVFAGASLETVLGEEASLFDKGLIDIHTARTGDPAAANDQAHLTTEEEHHFDDSQGGEPLPTH